MADSKITALTAISTVDPTADPLVIVDVSDTSMAASGTTKKGTINQLLGSGGTATLASATITGDLTVDTSTLKVVAASDVVGINTASPLTGNDAGLTIGAIGTVKALNIGLQNTFARLREKDAIDAFAITTNITGSNNQDDATKSSWKVRMGFGNGNDNFLISRSGVGSTTFQDLYSISTTSAVWSDGAGGTRMTLNATGLGIGASPSYKLDVLGVSAATVASGAAFRAIRSSSGDRCLIVPLAAGSGFTIQSQNAAESDFTPIIFSGSTTTFNYRTGIGTVTTGMTLDASGNLLLGKTVNSITTVGFQSTATGEVSAALAASTNAATQWTTYSTGAAAYRFYVGMGGTVFATNTTISAISDSRLKENVQDLDVGLNEILALKPRKFDWKAGKGKDIKGDRGFIAQEFETVFPNLIDEWKDNAPEGEAPYKSVRQDLIPVLVKAIQELTARVQTLETR